MSIRSILFFFLILVGISSCFEEAGFDSIENAVDVENCDFYGVMNDSLWCGTASLAVFDGDAMNLRFDKDGPLVNGYPTETISIRIKSFEGAATYFLEDGDVSVLKQNGTDTFETLYSLNGDRGDSSELEIFSFNEDTNETLGAIRFSIINPNRTPQTRRLTGGRFNVIVRE